MKINNETKIGILAVVGVAVLIIGYNFLKGKSLFKKPKYVYARFEDIQGLGKSNPVVINGLQIGHVADLNGGKDLKSILVTVELTQDVLIPNNSLAVINPSLLGGVSLEVKLGNSNKYLKLGDTLLTTLSGGAFDEALKMINPVLYEVRNAVKSLDSVLHIVTGVFDPETKNNIKGVIANLNTVTGSFTVSAASLQTLLNTQNGAFAKSLDNVSTFTNNLNANNGKLNTIVGNAEKMSNNLAALNLQRTLNTVDSAANQLKAGIAKINSNNGSIGLLLNDTKLYDNLSATSNKINILLDDIRVHPKRYLTISVFGKKDKGDYITAPLVDDTLKVPAKTK
ncbi:MAG: MlaD family protein [Bacteroidota bacterium]|nr:MlaD family protein [Bacteroidota bacterium]